MQRNEGTNHRTFKKMTSGSFFLRHCAPVTVPRKNDPKANFLKTRWPTMPKPLPTESDADPNGSPDRVPKSTISGHRTYENLFRGYFAVFYKKFSRPDNKLPDSPIGGANIMFLLTFRQIKIKKCHTPALNLLRHSERGTS